MVEKTAVFYPVRYGQKLCDGFGKVITYDLLQIDTFRKPGSPKLTYSDLYDGVFLSDVMQDM